MNTVLNFCALGRHRSSAFYTVVALIFFHASSAESKVFTVNINDMKFDPPSLEAHVGDTVIWKNLDIFPHTVSTPDKKKPRIESGTILSGKSFSFKLRRVGSIDYFCRFHTVMKGSLKITE